MKILSVASGLPYPPDDGTRIRTWHFLSRLSSTSQVTLATWNAPGDDPDGLDVVRERLDEVILSEIRARRESLWSRLGVRSRSFVAGLPPFIVEKRELYPVPVMDDHFDVAVAEDDAAAYLMPRVSCPIVVHRHNVFADTIEQLYASGSLGGARRMKWALELPIWRKFDRDLSSRVDLSVVTTPESAESLTRRVPGHRVEVVGNGVFVPGRQLVPGNSSRAVFIGTMSYEPNADAAVRFSKRVWPKIVGRMPQATFDIIGRGPLKEVQRLHGGSIRVLGGVEDMVDACNGARLGIVPLYAGSGIKNKTIELMAMGLPVVASPNGSEGVTASEEDGLLRAENEEEFAEKVCLLMQDAALAERLGAAARTYVERNFSWDEKARLYEALLRRVVSRPSGPREVAAR